MNDLHKLGLAVQIRESFYSRYGEHPDNWLKELVLEEWENLLEQDQVDVVWEAWGLTAWTQQLGILAYGTPFDGTLIYFLLGLTPFDPVPPHLFCKECGYFKMYTEVPQGDMLFRRRCPACGKPLTRSGFQLTGFEREEEYEFHVAPHHEQKARKLLHTLGGRHLKICPDESLAPLARLNSLDTRHPKLCEEATLDLFGNGMFSSLEDGRIGCLGVLPLKYAGLLDAVRVDSFWEFTQVVGAHMCGVADQVERLILEGGLRLENFSFTIEESHRKAWLGERCPEAEALMRDVDLPLKSAVIREAAKYYHLAAYKTQRVSFFYAWALSELRLYGRNMPLPSIQKMQLNEAADWVDQHFNSHIRSGDVRTLEQLDRLMVDAHVPELVRTYLLLLVEITTCYPESDLIYGRVHLLLRTQRRFNPETYGS